MELQERQLAGVAHAQVMRLDGAGGAFGHQFADAVNHGGFRRGVHQAADRGIDHRHARPQHIDAGRRGEHRVEYQVAGQHDQSDADGDANRSDDIGEQMPAVGESAPASAGAFPVRISSTGPCAVQQRGDGIQCDALPGMRERMRVAARFPGVAEDRQRGDDDQDAFDDRGEELHLVVAVRMVRIGRDGGKAQGRQSDEAGRNVDDAFQRIGVERRAAGDPPGNALHAQHQAANRDAACCDALSSTQCLPRAASVDRTEVAEGR